MASFFMGVCDLRGTPQYSRMAALSTWRDSPVRYDWAGGSAYSHLDRSGVNDRKGCDMAAETRPDRMNQLVWLILAVLGAVLGIIGVYRYVS
jgi:hypothetical protein